MRALHPSALRCTARCGSLLPSSSGFVTTVLLLLLSGAACDRGVADPDGVDRVYEVPAGIDASGTRDVTRELLDFFATVPDTATIAFKAGAIYRIERTLRLEDRHSLTFEGNGASFIATDPAPFGITGDGTYDRRNRTRSHWHLIGGSGLRFRNMVVRGANPNAGTSEPAYVDDFEAQHGFDVWGVKGLELDHITVTDVYGDFVYLSNRRDNGQWSSDIHIHDSHFERNGRQGIGFAGTENVLIERNYIGQTRRASMDFEPYNAGAGIRRVIVRENTFGPGRLLFLAAGSSAAAKIDEILVAQNRLTGKTMNVLMRSPATVRHSRVRFIGNTTDAAFGSPIPLMHFTGIDGIEVRNNVNPLDANRNMTAVYASESCAVEVAGNSFSGAAVVVEIVPYVCP